MRTLAERAVLVIVLDGGGKQRREVVLGSDDRGHGASAQGKSLALGPCRFTG